MWSLASIVLGAVVTSSTPAPHDCVILLHGLARSARSLSKLERVLEATGYVVANVDYPSRRDPIDVLADRAVTEGLAVCAARATGQIHFVTHSMGGILVREYLSRKTIPNLGRVVMLAPPNQGSAVVDTFSRVPGYRVLNGPAGYQLGTQANSVPLALGPVRYPVGIIAGTKSVNPILSMSLARPNDGKVSVEDTKVEGMADFLAVPVSHPFIMRNPVVIGQTLRFLATGQFDHPAA